MSSARAYANQALYHAKILQACWEQRAEEAAIPAGTLSQAFLPAVTHHLLISYGWFLLELADVETPPDGPPPRSTAQLPAIVAGKAESGELREVARLEREGFLGELLAVQSAVPAAPAQAGGARGELAVRTLEGPGLPEVSGWIAEYEQLCDRMRNSLDEY